MAGSRALADEALPSRWGCMAGRRTRCVVVLPSVGRTGHRLFLDYLNLKCLIGMYLRDY